MFLKPLESGNIIHLQPGTKTIIGRYDRGHYKSDLYQRGEKLGIFDSRISRQHASIFVNEDGRLISFTQVREVRSVIDF
jgi:hypothetical protein